MTDRKIIITINPKVEGDVAVRTTLETRGYKIKGSEFVAAVCHIVSFLMDKIPEEEKSKLLAYMQDLIISVYESKK